MTRRRHGKRYTPPRSVAEGFAALSCEARGCNCAPDITLAHDNGVVRVQVAHDVWCAVFAQDAG